MDSMKKMYLIKDLRFKTGFGLIRCKEALERVNWDMKLALDELLCDKGTERSNKQVVTEEPIDEKLRALYKAARKGEISEGRFIATVKIIMEGE